MHIIGRVAFYTSAEAAHQLGIAPSTLRHYRSEGTRHMDWTKVGGLVLYEVAAVDQYRRKLATA